MKVKVSKVFAQHLNSIKDYLDIDVARVVSMDEHQYRLNVTTDTIEAMIRGDYTYDTRMYKAIRIDYPAEYYACPRYLTTKELNDEFARHNVKDIDGLNRMLKSIIEI